MFELFFCIPRLRMTFWSENNSALWCDYGGYLTAYSNSEYLFAKVSLTTFWDFSIKKKKSPNEMNSGTLWRTPPKETKTKIQPIFHISVMYISISVTSDNKKLWFDYLFKAHKQLNCAWFAYFYQPSIPGEADWEERNMKVQGSATLRELWDFLTQVVPCQNCSAQLQSGWVYVI